MGPGHLISGALVGVTAAHLAGLHGGDAVLLAALWTWTADSPDIDTPRSLFTRSLGPVGWVLSWLVRRFSHALGLPEHRGISHMAIFILPVCGLLEVGVFAAGWVWWIGPVVLGGMVTHLLGDLPTKSGVPVFWFPGRDERGCRIWITPSWFRLQVGSDVEYLAVYPVLVLGLVAVSVVWPYFDSIRTIAALA